MTKAVYGPDRRFASERANYNHERAIDALLDFTGSSDRAGASRVITAIAAYIMRDYADRAKTT